MMPAPEHALTMVVTTYNRYPQLLRLLKYAAGGLPYAIEVLDSSSDPLDSHELRELLAAPHVRHQRYAPATPPMQKIAEGLTQVTTPYAVLWADDDFLVTRSLARGVDFLARHPDYSVVHGQSALFALETREGQRVSSCLPYWQCHLPQETAAQRLRAYFKRYGVLNYAIHRTAHLRQHAQLCHQQDFGYHWAELALGSLAVIQGKVKRLPCLYLLKEARQGPDAWVAWSGGADPGPSDGFYEWVTGPAFAQQYERFRTCLAEALAREDAIELPAAHAVVKEACWSYFAKTFTTKWHQRYAERPRRRLREAARRLPGLRTAWRKARHLVPHRPGALSLPALLQPTSPYHEDFMPIYQLLTEPAPVSEALRA